MTNYSDSLLKTGEDWRYSNSKMEVREQALRILLKRFGSELQENGESKYSNKSIYECVHDWVSQGNMRTDGIVNYYKAYYFDK
jgi:hypothetical protein